MNGILGNSVLDEALGGDIEYVSLIDRVRNCEGEDEVCKEAAQVLREVRELIVQNVAGPWTQAELLAGELLDAMSLQYTHEISHKEYVGLDIIASMEGTLPDGRQIETRGVFRAADLLEDAVRVLVEFRFLPTAADLLSRITSRARLSRAALPDLNYCLHCDGLHPVFSSRCWRTSPSVAIEPWVAPLARRAGWFVSDEKDLCPDCWKDADPEAAAKGNPPDPDFPIEFGDFDLPTPTPDGEGPIPPPMSEEDQLRDMAGMLCSFLSMAGSVDIVMEQVLGQYGVDALKAVAADLPPNDLIFEIMNSVDPPLSPDAKSNLGELLDRIRALAPPAAPSPVQEEDILDRFFREAEQAFDGGRSHAFSDQKWPDLIVRLPEARDRLSQYSGELQEFIAESIRFVWEWQDNNPETMPVRLIGQLINEQSSPYLDGELIRFADQIRRRFLHRDFESLTKILRLQITPAKAVVLLKKLDSVDRIRTAVSSQSFDDPILTPKGLEFLGQLFEWLAEYGAST